MSIILSLMVIFDVLWLNIGGQILWLLGFNEKCFE